MRKLLKYLWIIQEQKFKDSFNRQYIKKRINPYNPLTYLALTIMFIIGILMFGFVGFWKETDNRNPFKWN